MLHVHPLLREDCVPPESVFCAMIDTILEEKP